MKQLLVLSVFIFSTLTIGIAQKNCCNPLDLTFFPGFPVTFSSTSGSGEPDDVSCSCLSGEGGSTWFAFSAMEGGKFEFLIEPKTPGTNFNFSIWEDFCPCQQSQPPSSPNVVPVVCNSAAGNGPTGVASDPMTTFGVPNSAEFSPTINLVTGKNYFLLVSNVANDGLGFTFTMGNPAGTAVLGHRIPPPNSGPIEGPSTVCLGGSAIFTVPPQFGATNYQWDVIPGGIPVNGPQPQHALNFPSAGIFQVCVQATGPGLGCFATAPSCMSVTVAPIPNPAGFASDIICTGDVYVAPNGEAFFFGGVHDVHYVTSQGCDSIVKLTLTQLQPDYDVIVKQACEGTCVEFKGETICETGTYEEVLTNQFGCDSTTLLFFISVPVEAKITGADTIDCIKTSIVLSGATSPGGANMTYMWKRNGQPVGTGPTLTVTTGGSYTLTTQSTVGSDTCVDQATVFIVADNTPPQLTAMGGVITCASSSVTLQANSTTPNVTYGWTGPGGFASNLQNPTVSLTGTYTVKAIAMNGCSKSANAVVTGNTELPNATATGGSVTCLSSQVMLNGQSTTPGVAYSWEGPGGVIYNQQNPVVSTVGDYILTVTAPNGCKKSTSTSVIDNTAPPLASAAVDDNLNCFTSTVTLSGAGSSIGGQYSYLWSTTDGNVAFGGTTLTPTVDAPGTYTLLVTNSNNGCTGTASATVVESPDVTASIASQTNVLCFGEATGSATVTAGGGVGNFTYEWSDGQTTATATGLIAGNYSVTSTDGEGCASVQSVTVSQPATPIAVNASATPQIIFGVNDGTATANPTGGTGPYASGWNSGGTTQTITGLAPGNYTVIITDANGCTASQTVTVNEITCAVQIDIAHQDVSCPGAADGSATVNLASATPPFSFIWSNGETTQTVNQLSGGTYSVSSTDANGCEVVATVTVQEPSTFSANATSTDLTGFNSDDGTATANPTGGTAPYTYLWDNNETTATIGNLEPGNYTVSVSDGNGCEAVQTVIVLAFNCFMTANVISANATCNGSDDGQATVTLANGTAPFTYEWSNGGTTATIENLAPDTYSATATDAAGCPAVVEVAITEPTVLGIDFIELIEPDCGASNGLVTAAGTGGTPGYNYEWSNGDTDNTIDGVAAGTYSVSITDANGCEAAFEVVIGTIDDVPPTLDCPEGLALPSCDPVAEFTPTVTDNCTGTIQLTQTSGLPSGSTFPVGQTTVAFVAEDASGNSSTCSFEVTVPTGLSVTLSSVNVSCFGHDDGSIAATTTGGSPGYTYLWSNGATTPTVTGLIAGPYSVSVTDQDGCTSVKTNTVTQPPLLLTLLVTITNDTAGQQSGAIDVDVNGGVPPYTYIWTDLAGNVLGNQQDISGLAAGTYQLRVTDANGCISLNGYTIQTVNSTSEPGLDSHLLLYPNPTSGWVTLELTDLPTLPDVEVTALDVTGRVAYSYAAVGNKHLLDFTAKPSGVYFLKILVGNQMLTKRLVVSR
ncbi:MAG: T9SS type A sorting domain-containing protein [Bacteroidetes bacterium]|nr:T9SS type A sorting domain-containing protein [Bacteroidota bacterium]